MAEVPPGLEIKIAISMTLQSWYDEGINYDYTLVKPNISTSDFTTIVWKSSTKLGFGVAQLKDGRIYIVLYFDPAGNIAGQYIQNVLPSTGKSSVKNFGAVLNY